MESIGCRGWARTTTVAFKGRCPAIRRPGNYIKWWAREDLHLQGSQILDLWGLLFPPNHSPLKMTNDEFNQDLSRFRISSFVI